MKKSSISRRNFLGKAATVGVAGVVVPSIITSCAREKAAASIFKGKRPTGYPYSAAEFPGFTPKLNANGLIDYYKTAMTSGYQFRLGTDYLYSIPIDEITLNSNLVQNPGW